MQQFDATISDATTLRAEDGPAPPLPDLAEPTCSASQRESRTVPETGGEWRPGMLGGIFAWTGRPLAEIAAGARNVLPRCYRMVHRTIVLNYLITCTTLGYCFFSSGAPLGGSFVHSRSNSRHQQSILPTKRTPSSRIIVSRYQIHRFFFDDSKTSSKISPYRQTSSPSPFSSHSLRHSHSP